MQSVLRALQQLAGVVRLVREHRDADRGVGRDGIAAELHRRREQRHYPVRREHGDAFGGRGAQHARELVARKRLDQVALAQRLRAQNGRDIGGHAVARVETVQSVDAIDRRGVHEQQSDGFAHVLCFRERELQALDERVQGILGPDFRCAVHVRSPGL